MKKIGTLILLVMLFVTRAYCDGVEKQIRLMLQDTVSGMSDETDVYLDLGIGPYYVPVQDAEKKFDTIEAVPQIWAMTIDSVPCYSYGYGNFTKSIVITLGFRVAGGSVYSFIPEVLSNFDPTTIILLEDRATRVFHDLRQGPYTVAIDSADNSENRFYLHISYPPAVTDVPAGCTNDNGAITIDEDSTIVWSACQLYDSTMNFITAYSEVSGNFNFSGLTAGNYNLAFIYGIYSAITPINITGNQIIASISASSQTVQVGDTINFYSSATNTSNYFWTFGDSTEITGIANPQMDYSTPGDYTVVLECTNADGCVSYAYIQVDVTAATGIASVGAPWIKIITEQRNLLISTNITAPLPLGINVYNMAGQLINTGMITAQTSNINLSNQPAGMYIVRLITDSQSFTQKVMLE